MYNMLQNLPLKFDSNPSSNEFNTVKKIKKNKNNLFKK